MRSILILLAFSFTFLFSSCTKESQTADAILTGFDGRYCICCGGLMITFYGETEPYKGEFKLIDNTSDMGIGFNEPFPIRVEVAWVSVPNKCSGNFIKVLSLKRK